MPYLVTVKATEEPSCKWRSFLTRFGIVTCPLDVILVVSIIVMGLNASFGYKATILLPYFPTKDSFGRGQSQGALQIQKLTGNIVFGDFAVEGPARNAEFFRRERFIAPD